MLTYLLAEAPPASSAGGARRWDKALARALLGFMGMGLGWYLVAKSDPVALTLFGLGPLGVIAWAACRAVPGNRETARMILGLAAGGLAALAPLLFYHLANGSLGFWFDDTVLAGLALTELPFIDDPRHLNTLLLALGGVFAPADAAALLNGLFWIVLLMLAPALAVATLAGLWRQDPAAGARHYLVPMLALFYAPVAVHFQTPIYLLFVVAPLLAGLLWLAGARPGRARAGMVALTLSLVVVGLHYQAGQSLRRGLTGIVAGERAPVAAVASVPGLAGVGLRIGADDAAMYGRLMALIEGATPPGAAILALPVNPEFYVLSGRRNPTRFFNAALGIRSRRDLETVLDTLRRDPPLLVFHRPNDKYNTPLTARLMDFVRRRYEPVTAIDGFHIYRHRQELATQPVAPPGPPPGPTPATPSKRSEP